MPWSAIQSLILNIYGDKVDNRFDHRILHKFIKSILNPKLFDIHADLVKNSSASKASLEAPVGTKMEDFLNWTRSLDYEDPSWLGFVNTQRVLSLKTAHEFVSDLKRLRITHQFYTVTDDKSLSFIGNLDNLATNYLSLLPNLLSPNKFSCTDPLSSFFVREYSIGNQTLHTVRRDLLELKRVCADKGRGITNDLIVLRDHILKGLIPPSWKDFSRRSN